AVPGGGARLRSARLRSRALLPPRGGQERAGSRRGPPRLLLLHPDALRVGPLRRLLRASVRPGRACPDAAGGGVAPALGPADRGGRPPVRGDLALRGRPHPARLRARRGRHLPAGGCRALSRGRGARGILSGGLGPDPVQAGRPGGGGVQSARAAAGDRGDRSRGPPAAGPRRAHGRAAGLARRRPDRGALRALSGPALPPARGFRYHAARGDGGGAAGHRLRRGRRPGDGGAARGRGAPDRALLREPDRGGSRRRDPALRGLRPSIRAQGPAPARGSLRPPALSRTDPRVPAGAGGGIDAVLKAYSRLLEQLMLVVDLVLVGLCWLLAYWLRFHVAGPPLPYQNVPPLSDYLLMLLPILVVWSVSFHAFGLYRPRRIGSHLSEAVDIAKASTMGVLVLVAVMTFFFRGYDYSRVAIVYFGLLSIGVVWFSRAAFRELLRFARRRGYNQRFAVVVGDGELAATVVQRIRARSDVGIQVLGVVGDEKDDTGGVRRLGGYADLRAVLDAHTVDHVILALAHEDYGRLAGLLDAVGDEPVTIHVVPDLLRFASLRGGIEQFEGMPFIHLRESPLYGWNQLAKRVFDFAFSAVVLAVIWPVLLLLAVAVKSSSRGPVFYRQERMGLDGRRFEMLKFRTMDANAESKTGPVWAGRADQRRTNLGAFLRRLSLDELPQFWNVLRGDMSVVGPRPERPVFVERFRQTVPGYMLRHKVKSGITGWAQVNGLRGNTSLEKRIQYDIEYIERWSVWLDIKIIAMTVVRVLVDRNAY